MPPFYKKKKLPVVVARDKRACVFCERVDDDEQKYGKFLFKDETRVHNFCMLFASGLSQNGSDDEEGILGFLDADIKKELKRSSKMTCRYCGEVGAAVGCSVKSCKQIFHMGCGFENGGLFQFYGSFNAYCADHRPEQQPLSKREIGSPSPECPICFCDVENRPSTETLRAPCCTRAWYHRQCIQQQARTAGLHFFRCPLCNEQECFQKEMLIYGVYIPDQDAAWETEPNAFQDLLERYNNCDVAKCRCPKGRNYDQPEKDWNLLVCCTCSSAGAHSRCVGLKTRNPDYEWTCKDCRKVVGVVKYKKKSSCKKVAMKEERRPYKTQYNPIQRGTKRKRTSAWARGMVKSASKRLRVVHSPWKSAGTVSLKGELTTCGVSPGAGINCTDRCRQGLHRPRIPILRLDRVDTDSVMDKKSSGGTYCNPTPSTSGTNDDVMPYDVVMPYDDVMSYDFMTYDVTSPSVVGTPTVEVDYSSLAVFDDDDEIVLVSSDSAPESAPDSAPESAPECRDLSSPDSDVRRAAMEFCELETPTSSDSPPDQAFKRLVLINATAASTDESTCSSNASNNSSTDKDSMSISRESWPISCTKKERTKESRKYKPKRSKTEGTLGCKSILSYFIPIKPKPPSDELGGRHVDPDKAHVNPDKAHVDAEKKKPVMSVKPTRAKTVRKLLEDREKLLTYIENRPPSKLEQLLVFSNAAVDADSESPSRRLRRKFLSPRKSLSPEPSTSKENFYTSPSHLLMPPIGTPKMESRDSLSANQTPVGTPKMESRDSFSANQKTPIGTPEMDSRDSFSANQKMPIGTTKMESRDSLSANQTPVRTPKMESRDSFSANQKTPIGTPEMDSRDSFSANQKMPIGTTKMESPDSLSANPTPVRTPKMESRDSFSANRKTPIGTPEMDSRDSFSANQKTPIGTPKMESCDSLSANQKTVDDFPLIMSDSDISDLDSISYIDLIQSLGEKPSQPITFRDTPPPRPLPEKTTRPLIEVISSDGNSGSISTSSDDVTTHRAIAKPMNSNFCEIANYNRQGATLAPTDLSSPPQVTRKSLSSSSTPTTNKGLFDLRNLKSRSSSEDGLFDLKMVPGFVNVDMPSSQSDQENSEPDPSTLTRRRKKLRLRRRKSDLVRSSSVGGSSSSSTDSLSRLPLADKRPIGIVQPTRSTNQNR